MSVETTSSTMLIKIIFFVYILYFIAVSYALVSCFMSDPSRWVILFIPAVTISAHFLFLFSGIFLSYIGLLKNYNPYPVEPKLVGVFKVVDVCMFLAATLAYILFFTHNTDTVTAGFINFVAIVGNLFCFYKSISLIQNNKQIIN